MVKLRFEVTPVLAGFDAVMRLLWQNSGSVEIGASLEEDLRALGYLPEQAKMIHLSAQRSTGGIVFSGQTGSGKTTSLYKIMRHAAQPTKKCYSVEDPIEARISNVSQIQVNVTEGQNVDDAVSDIVRSMLRLDPDIVMVSEIRGAETGSAFKQLIQTGHQVLTTVHASSALGIFERLASGEIAIPREVLADADFLVLLVYQKLLRCMCEHCKVPLHQSADIRPDLAVSLSQLFDTSRVYTTNPAGCEHCRREGHIFGVAGRTACAEVLRPSTTLLRLLLEHRTDLAIQKNRERRTALDDANPDGKSAAEVALYKVSQGQIDPREFESEFMPLSLYIELQEEFKRESLLVSDG